MQYYLDYLGSAQEVSAEVTKLINFVDANILKVEQELEPMRSKLDLLLYVLHDYDKEKPDFKAQGAETLCQLLDFALQKGDLTETLKKEVIRAADTFILHHPSVSYSET